MKIQPTTGTVVERTCYLGSDGAQHYSITIREDGLYPSPYKFTSKDPTLFGKPDGLAGVGKRVTVDGYVRSMEKTFQKRDGTQGKAINYWLILHSLTSAAAPAPDAPAATPPATDEVDETLPF